MQLSPIYEQRLTEAIQQGREEGRQEGRQEGVQQGIQTERRTIIENLLRVRFGALDNSLQAIIEPLLVLSSEEFSSFLLHLPNLSREDLLTRFRQQ